MKITNFKAFTLIELLAAISVISIVMIAGSRINLSSQKTVEEKIKIEAIKVKNILEEARSNALVGRSNSTIIDEDLIWKVVLWSANEHIRLYSRVSGVDTLTREYVLTPPFEILSVDCKNISGSQVEARTSVGTVIHFEGKESQIITDCSWVDKESILEINIGNALYQETIRVNTVSWVIESLSL